MAATAVAGGPSIAPSAVRRPRNSRREAPLALASSKIVGGASRIMVASPVWGLAPVLFHQASKRQAEKTALCISRQTRLPGWKRA
jgi:hypothetical protein